MKWRSGAARQGVAAAVASRHISRTKRRGCLESSARIGEIGMAASSDSLHAPRERLSKETIHLHHAIVSLMEELEAVDWYRQRADDCDDKQLKEILLHNMREEMEHAAMVLEWIRRNSPDFEKHLKDFLFTDGEISDH
jgi:hypothetical protein